MITDLGGETLPQQPTAELAVTDFLNGAGNHELKLLLSAIVLAYPEREFTENQANKELSQRQGEVPVWPIGPKVSRQYFERSLEPIGAVVKRMAPGERGKVIPWYCADPEFREHKLALTGFLLNWSLDYQDDSLQQVYSGSMTSGEVHAPETRHELFRALLANDEGVSIRTLAEESFRGSLSDKTTLERHVNVIERHIDLLETQGIVQKISKARNYDPLLEIIDPAFNHVALSQEDLRAETQALYTAMEQLGQGTQLTATTLVEAAQRIDPSIDDVKLLGTIRGTLHSRDNRSWLPGLQQVGEAEISQSDMSSIRLEDRAHGMIADLTEGVDAIRHGVGLASWTSRAVEVINSQAAFSTLVQKARDASPYAIKAEGATVVAERLFAIARGLGIATLDSLVTGYESEHGGSIRSQHIRLLMKRLVEQGEFRVEKVPARPHTKRLINRYVRVD